MNLFGQINSLVQMSNKTKYVCTTTFFCHKCMFLKQFEIVLELLNFVTLTFDPVIPKSLEFLCYPGWMCGLSLRKVGQGVLQLLIGNVFGTFDLSNLNL